MYTIRAQYIAADRGKLKKNIKIVSSNETFRKTKSLGKAVNEEHKPIPYEQSP